MSNSESAMSASALCVDNTFWDSLTVETSCPLLKRSVLEEGWAIRSHGKGGAEAGICDSVRISASVWWIGVGELPLKELVRNLVRFGNKAIQIEYSCNTNQY